MTAKSRLISIVVPIKNEEENVRVLYERTKAVFDSLEGFACEFVYVDDGSTDESVAAV
jgi:polyisoprenyl-phosphate glycosyltransferase